MTNLHRAGSAWRVLAIAVAIVMAGACGGDEGGDGAGADAGRVAFETHCISCHGANAAGTQQGPPLVDQIYEPSHHSDDAFRSAAANGVQPHHWDFGPMPPVPGIEPDEVEAVIAYIRGLQREAGIE